MKHEQKIRYSRHISLPEMGEAGQERLLNARVLAIGAGGLGAPALLYLAAAGVGTLGIADDDAVVLSNLQRQILYESSDIGQKKVEAAQLALSDRNPDISIHTYPMRVNADNIDALLVEYDVIIDGSDNFATRILINDRCHALGKVLVSAAISGFSGQLSTFKSYNGAPHPCYRCLYPSIPEEEQALSCADSGVLGSVAGIMGVWQSLEVIKEITGVGEGMSGKLLLFDGLTSKTRQVAISRDPECVCCGKETNETLLDVSGYQCPMPILKAKKTLKTMPDGAVLKLISTDPASLKEIPDFCSTAGYCLLRKEERENQYIFWLRK